MRDGSVRSAFTRFDLGEVGKISELQARREHDRVRKQINQERGSVPTAPKGETFMELSDAYMKTIAPHLSISTVRQRKSHLRAHLLPRFGNDSVMSLDARRLQNLATELVGKLSRKTIINIMGTIFAIFDYARRCSIQVPDVSLKSITLVKERVSSETPYFKRSEAERIIEQAREPYRTMFALLWMCGFRAGELLGLRICDVDLDRKIIRPQQQADDRTRVLRELKTPESVSAIPITTETANILRNYLMNHWTKNPQELLFPNRCGRPWKRATVVKFGLRPILNRLGMQTQGVGLHAFRRGLGTALADSRVSPKVVQSILRHTDIKTTLRFYVHVDEDVQRKALQSLQTRESLHNPNPSD